MMTHIVTRIINHITSTVQALCTLQAHLMQALESLIKLLTQCLMYLELSLTILVHPTTRTIHQPHTNLLKVAILQECIVIYTE